MKKIYILVFALAIGILRINSQVPFHKGINLTNWFQTSGAKQIQFTKYTKQDFINIKSLGCDAIRLPINLHSMTSGKPNYTVDPLFYEFLDQAVSWAEDLKIYLLLDNHSTDDIASKNPDLGILIPIIWEQLANHYKNASNFVLFEIMNEPNGITTAAWGKIQQSAIEAIRKIDLKHTIVVGASSYNTYNEMKLLPLYSDTNLIYTFHFYDPMVFTHQGATWVDPNMNQLAGVPFPYSADSMPTFPAAITTSWVKSAFDNYKNEGNAAHLKSLIDIAIAFRDSRNVKIYCGEFGVFKDNSKDSDRVRWYNVIRSYLEEKNIPWTIWDYQGGFGLFKKGSNEMFNYDLNTSLLKALNLNIPPLSKYVMIPDTVGYAIYSDFIGQNIVESSNASGGIVDFYSDSKPNNGKYCIHWTATAQYGSIGFDLRPDKDMSQLVANNYAISFLVRCNVPGTKFDIRFIDSKTTDPTDHPWRINYAVSETNSKWDSKWHKVFIPLKNLIDAGSYDNGQWYNAAGKYDWKAIDRFDIVAEESDLKGKDFWFDNIFVSNSDTAKIVDTSTFIPITALLLKTAKNMEFDIFPNPVKYSLTINYSYNNPTNFEIGIYNITGQKLVTFSNEAQFSNTGQINWNLRDISGNRVLPGIYICRYSSGNITMNKKIFVQ